ncbi:MAG: hypothetical protein ACTJHT_12525 [Sphingobacterium sp.]|uniref:hypothetical protein n=1 Tax=Sphingobacterium sp. JB170 TaxID=1434842 RepID=UPI00097EF716|nr:hypothetical protein [Sphingobacterium sp. JB170]SJN35687.1 hypothetical protein FM107_08520 [Sphingobacterium sp. JB170]
MEKLLKSLVENKMLNQPISKFILLIDEQGKEHGALFFIEVGKRNYKLTVPHPHHIALIKNGLPTAKQIVYHQEAMLLK